MKRNQMFLFLTSLMWMFIFFGVALADWTTGVSFTHALSVTLVGPFVGNCGYPECSGKGTAAPGFTGLIDYFFNTASPIVPEI